jgi:hypothetical protein
MILLDERHEVLMLVTNSLKMDLNNARSPYTVGLALAALGNICSAAMARDLAPDVGRLMEDANPYVRKKAALCAIRCVGFFVCVLRGGKRGGCCVCIRESHMQSSIKTLISTSLPLPPHTHIPLTQRRQEEPRAG